MTTVLLVIHFFIAAFLVGVVLIQRSEGGALSGLGAGGGMMSARGTANLLTRATGILAAMFFASSLLIAIVVRSPDSGKSVILEDHKKVEAAKEAEALAPESKSEAAPMVAPAPHTEGEAVLVENPEASATQGEPVAAAVPAKGVESDVKNSKENKK
ncbi:MAG: preprotein translocase subunit SecG [Alphaproteobacteria bacterium]|nr:preprotein translocase subunit SecG [Alphaproteobacteria bacterium]